MFGSDDKHFHQVIPLQDGSVGSWEALSRQIPHLPRGWYELARLPIEYRIEFTRDYWLSQLWPVSHFFPELERACDHFFSKVEEIDLFATQVTEGASFDVHMVYSLKDYAQFFQGAPPATLEKIERLERQFSAYALPQDYLAFLRIHDGFSKYTDTGILKSVDLSQIYQKLQHSLAQELLVRPDGESIDPASLIPFYESDELHHYQCFYADWCPEEEMGNLFFSESDRAMSNFLDLRSMRKNLAFPSFLDWLFFYLEPL